MRRLLAIVVLLAGAAAAIAANGGGESKYRVDAIFDNASSLIPGNVVKIAGAPAGEVKDIRLTPERRARVEIEIDPEYGPFRSDARCVIAPESLFIGEKFLQCEPGTPDGRPLSGRDGRAPTVALDRNSSTVDLDLVLSTLRLPVRERLTILFNELGAGLAGRPKELNQVVRRANPALQATDRVLRILDGDRATLGRLVEQSDTVLAELSARRRNVQGFITRANRVTAQTAARQDALAEGVRRLPPLLDELEPGAERLSDLARQATPAVRQLRAAAPDVAELLRDVEPLSRAGRPAVAALGRTARVGRRATRPARPLARRLARASRLLPPVVRTATGLAQNLQDRGGPEGLGSFLYNTALTTSRFDRVSHILPAYLTFNTCSLPATEPVEECDSRFGGASSRGKAPPLLDRRRLLRETRRAGAESRRAAERSLRRRRAAARSAPAAPREAAPAPAPAGGERAPAPGLRELGVPVLDYLLGP
jgi:ABC-type transporter Mla subunit MlaD